MLRGRIGRFLGLPVLLDLGKQLLDERRVGGPEGSFGIAEVELDGLNGLLHDVGELFPNRQIAPSGHLLDEGDDLVFHVFVDGVGLAGRGADEVDVLDDGLDVVGDELRGRGLGAFGLLAGFVIVVEEGDEVVDEGQIGDGPKHLVLALPHLLGFLDVDVFAFGVAEDALNHGIDVLVDREHAFVDRQMLVVVDAEPIVGEVEDGRFIAIDLGVEIADELLELLPVFPGVVDDVLKRGVLVDLDDDRALLFRENLWIVGLLLKAILEGVPDGDVVMDQRGQDFACLVHLFRFLLYFPASRAMSVLSDRRV